MKPKLLVMKPELAGLWEEVSSDQKSLENTGLLSQLLRETFSHIMVFNVKACQHQQRNWHMVSLYELENGAPFKANNCYKTSPQLIQLNLD